MTWEQIENVKAQAKKEALEEANSLMVLLPILILRDQFGFGEKRLERFVDGLGGLYNDIESKRLSIDDIAHVVEEETGFRIKMGT